MCGFALHYYIYHDKEGGTVLLRREGLVGSVVEEDPNFGDFTLRFLKLTDYTGHDVGDGDGLRNWSGWLTTDSRSRTIECGSWRGDRRGLWSTIENVATVDLTECRKEIIFWRGWGVGRLVFGSRCGCYHLTLTDEHPDRTDFGKCIEYTSKNWERGVGRTSQDVGECSLVESDFVAERNIVEMIVRHDRFDTFFICHKNSVNFWCLRSKQGVFALLLKTLQK